MAVIQVEGLRREFDDVVAVEDISFSVGDGEIFGLLGPNGAGKSTLINLLVTLLKPSSGTATVAGHDIVTDRSAVRDNIGIVFQEPALDEELTGAENLAFHARLYGMKNPHRKQRVDDILEIVGLENERDNRVSTYSGGMARRLEIGRGLLHEPKVLFLDEPTVGLDPGTRRDLWEYIQRLNEEEGISIIITTHYIEEAEFLCDQVAIVDDGNVVAVDTPDALKKTVGGDVVQLRVDGETGHLIDRLRTQPWISEVAMDDSTVQIVLEESEERIADIVHLADAEDVTISAITRQERSLEAAFLSLTDSSMSAEDNNVVSDQVVAEQGGHQ